MPRKSSDKKSIEFTWFARPYEVRWANNMTEVPYWDTSCGFPLEHSRENLTQGEIAYFERSQIGGTNSDDQSDPFHLDSTFHVRRKPPLSGYPRLVRLNIEKPVAYVPVEPADIVNKLARLSRNAPKYPPTKPVLTEIAKLNAQVGPVNDPANNTLESWLELSKDVFVHLYSCYYFKEFGYAEMCFRVSEEYYGFNQDLRLNGAVTDFQNPLKPLFTLLITPPSLYAAQWVEGSGPNKNNLTSEPLNSFTFVDEEEFLTNLNVFSNRNMTYEFVGNEIYSRVPFYLWVKAKLKDLWSPGAYVNRCKTCGQPFYTRNQSPRLPLELGSRKGNVVVVYDPTSPVSA